jgi:hypothetical protein
MERSQLYPAIVVSPSDVEAIGIDGHAQGYTGKAM